jgi:hypothetical protein
MKHISTLKKEITVNAEQRLYVIPYASGYTCHGFDVVERLAAHLIAEGLAVPPPLLRPIGTVDPSAAVGTPERYAYYRALCGEGAARNALTGWRSTAELTPELVGKEGNRVEVVHRWESGDTETTRFQVGKSSGWMPCHLQLARRGVSGGPAICLGDILSVRVIS